MDIVLEKFGAQHFDEYWRLVNDIRVMAMITECAVALDQAKADFAQLLRMNAHHEQAGHFRILDAQHGQFVGLGKLEIVTSDACEAELGYMILPAYWGQGVGSQVAAQLLEQARQMTGLRRVFAIIDPANLPSRKILLRQGFDSLEFKQFDGLPGEVLQLLL